MNLYVHFSFCRGKCRYCSLYSRVGVTQTARDAYVRSIAARLSSLAVRLRPLATVYFGGGSPALCDLSPLADSLRPLCSDDTEFTVELHPLDVTEPKLAQLLDIGVNRISMGVQSLDDATLRSMGRGYTASEAEHAFARVRERFDNVGIDLIVGYPGDAANGWERLSQWGLRHCSVYALQNERGLSDVPDDDWILDRIRSAAAFLGSIGLERYEISNYAVPGYACRHNLAVWRGEDYYGLGDGACGRRGLVRTRNDWGEIPHEGGLAPVMERLAPDRDAVERRIFRLRTREGLDAAGFPDWVPILDRHVQEELLTKRGMCYFLTERGTEVCDSILAELV